MKRTRIWMAVLCALCLPAAARGQVTPQVRIPGYTVARVSDPVDSSFIAQMAFKPGDTGHLFAVQTGGAVRRYDYDAVTGQLTNDRVVASGLGTEALGLGFHGDDLYVSLNLGEGDGRIARMSAPDVNGVYQTRHDFVHSIPMGWHDVDQIQIVGDTLYVGIGAVRRTGNPAEENVYTMTIARIVDLTQADFSGPIGPDFKGPVNHLANPTEWLNTSGSDGQLRYYASGFRNPFGIAIDDDGDLWVSTNGNSDAGFLSPDLLYGKVPLGGMGTFPPASFGYGPPYIVGTPIAPLADLGQNPSPVGFDFVPSGRDRGMVIVAQAGAADQAQYPVGKDVLRVDPVTGSFEILLDDMSLPTDVVRDPFGRLLVSDLADWSVWLLTPPPAEPAGRVPDGATGQPLTVSHAPGNDVTLDWSSSCAVGDDDYEVYEGTLGTYSDHQPVTCTTGGATTLTFAPAPGSSYFLVVPTNGGAEGSHGLDGNEAERPRGPAPCLPQAIEPVCP